MNQQPDKLFKQILESHQQLAPDSAWSKIETGLNKKKHKINWLYMAASILLISTVSVLMWLVLRQRDPVSQSGIVQVIPEKDSVTNMEELNVLPEHRTSSTQPALAVNVEPESSTSLPAQPTLTATLKKKKVIEASLVNASGTESPDIQKEIDEPDQIIIASTAPDPVKQDIEADLQYDRFKLVLEASEVNDKYLDKKSLVHATDDNTKSSRLKRVLDKAYDLKHNQDPFGDLRQMKNEILALNLQGDKKQQQNK